MWRLRALFLVCLIGCSPALDPLDDARSPRASLGAEVYKVLCRRMAGLALPDDVRGVRSEALCLGDADEVRAALARDAFPPRLRALALARPELVAALDAVLPEARGDALERLMRELLPFYDAPEERVQAISRELASLLEGLADDPRALAGLSVLGREGMVPAAGAFGLLRAPASSAGLQDFLQDMVPKVTSHGEASTSFASALTGLGLMLAASDDGALEDYERLLLHEVDDIAGAPWLVSLRDAEGRPLLRTGEPAAETRPSPFPAVGEATTPRDAEGRALASDGTGPRYRTRDVRRTVLGALLPTLGRGFDPALEFVPHTAPLVSALFGTPIRTTHAYGAGTFAYDAPDPAASPFLDLLDGALRTLPEPEFDDGLLLAAHLLGEQEPALVAALAPWLRLERRTRPADDAYPDASLTPHNTLLDELLGQAERLSRMRRAAHGESALEALLRAAIGFVRGEGGGLVRVIPLSTLSHQGSILSTFMRFKDEFRANPRGESEREPGEVRVRGRFVTEVDRTQPDAPVGCGKDGCGGPLAGSPFEDWLRTSAQQKCLLGNEGRSGSDCGSAGNQSLFSRSLGLVSELAGRAQANKRISLGDLFDFAVRVDPCSELTPATACEGTSASGRDAFCAARFGSGASAGDFACDAARNRCIVRRDSATCRALEAEQDRDRDESIRLATEAMEGDYRCPESAPEAPCHALDHPAAFIARAGESEIAIQPGHLLSLADVGRTFGRALTHEYTIEIPNPWVRRYLEDVARAADATLPRCEPGDIVDPREIPRRVSDGAACVPEAARLSRDVFAEMPAAVDSLGALIEFLLDDSSLFVTEADTAALRPEVSALTRVLFAPPGSSSFVVFDPLLVRDAPALCSDDALPACAMNQAELDAPGSCCLASARKPPLRYRLDTYYGATTFAWEHAFRFADGSQLSFLDAMKPVADAIHRTDFQPERGDDARDFEATDYVFSTLGALLAGHYGSTQTPRAHGTNLVSYEPMLADLLDDGSLADDDVAAAGVAIDGFAPMLRLLDRLAEARFPRERDGLSLLASLAEVALNPHRLCAGPAGDGRVLGGMGACDRALAGAPNLHAPIANRAGRTTLCWADGTCFDAPGARRTLSPAYLLLDALRAWDARLDAAAVAARREALGSLCDAYLANDGTHFDDRVGPALGRSLLDYARTRRIEEALGDGLPAYRSSLLADAEDLVQNPVFAGALGTLRSLVDDRTALTSLARFMHGMLRDEAALAALGSSLGDALECTPLTDDTRATLAQLSEAVLPGARAVVEEGGVVGAVEDGLVHRGLALTAELAIRDRTRTLSAVLEDSARSVDGAPSPLATLVSVLGRIERVETDARTPLAAEDYRQILRQVAEVLRDEEHGFERLFRIVQCRSGGPNCH